jgi:peptidase E
MNGIKPVYLLSGDSYHHRKSRDPLIREMLAETGRPHPKVAYIGTANGDDPVFFKVIKTLFERSGAGKVDLVPLAASDTNLEHARSLLEASDVIFISEGDVDLGMNAIRERNIAGLIRDCFLAGAVLAGFSAGSIMLSRQWVRWRDPDDNSTAESFDCIGIVPLVCDMHDEADDWEELKTLLRLRQVNDEIGYGIPTSMGLRVHPDNRIEAIGGMVHRYTFRDGRVDNIGEISPAFFVHPLEYEYQI